MIKLIFFCIINTALFSFSQTKIEKCFYLADKGIYVNWSKSDKKKKVPFKENEMFYFSLKNDSTAIVQWIYKQKLGAAEEYKISPTYDTVKVKRYSKVNGKDVIKVEKIVFQKLYR